MALAYDALLEPLFSFGARMLDDYGAFYPYAAVVGLDGAVDLVAREVEEQTPHPARLLDVLFEALRTHARNEACQASGLCVNVSVVDPRSGAKTDALKFVFEHRSGEALDVFFPYRKRGQSPDFEFDKPFAQPADRRVFSETTLPGGQDRADHVTRTLELELDRRRRP